MPGYRGYPASGRTESKRLHRAHKLTLQRECRELMRFFVSQLQIKEDNTKRRVIALICSVAMIFLLAVNVPAVHAETKALEQEIILILQRIWERLATPL